MGAFGPQLVITSHANGVKSVLAADLDGDGDPDVLSVWYVNGDIAWHENTDGLGAFAPAQFVTTGAYLPYSVFAADLDGDGDQDVLSAVVGNDRISWYKNSDGLGIFGPELIIDDDANGARWVVAADLDGDGDQDVLWASFVDQRIAWHQNTDGLGAFGPEQIITTHADGANSVFAADLDGDGDQDVLSASVGDNKIAWYENVGPTITVTCTPLSPPIVIPAGGGSYAFDIEIVNNSASAESFDFWADIEGPFTDLPGRVRTRTLAAGASLMHTVNKNVPGFALAGDYTHTCYVGSFPISFDADSFGFVKSALFAPGDVSVASWTTEAEFQAALGASDLTVEAPSNYVLEGGYPNPFNPHTTIRFGLPESAQVRLVVFDVLGREVAVLVDGRVEAGRHTAVFDGSGLPSGTYLVRLTTDAGVVRTQRLTLMK